MSAPMSYLDGNAAAGELSKIFAMDVTTAEGQCAHCGAIKRFAEAHLYMHAPGVVARCAVCQHVLLRLVSIRQRVFLDLRGMTYLFYVSIQTTFSHQSLHDRPFELHMHRLQCLLDRNSFPPTI
jgi:hypothetical protein